MITTPDEIKQLFFTDSIRKNIRIVFPNKEFPDITNSNLIAESFSFSESICSRDKLKFGLCEASVVKFETFGIGNINGKEIDVFHEIDITSLGEEFINQYGIRDNSVAFPFYRIPYGRFVVKSCEKQADMTRRKVVAYTKEITWDNVPNPVEKAKYNGGMDVKENSPYKFNVPAVIHSNLYEGDVDLFNDKTAITRKSGDFFQPIVLISTVSTGSGSYNTNKYSGHIYLECVYATISNNDDADNLFWINCGKIIDDGLEAFMNRFDEIINNTIYAWRYSRKMSSDELRQSLNYGFYKYLKYSYESGTYSESFLPLDDHKYIYPCINSENDNAYKMHGVSSYIAIPYRAIIVVNENIVYNNSHQTRERLRETFDIRNADDNTIYKINNLPQIYMSVERKKYTSGNNTGYRADKEKIDYRKLIEAYAEFNGYFGRHTRRGDFEFFRINNYFGRYPKEDLYPSDNIFPSDPNGGVFQGSQYISAWYDDSYTKPYDRVSVTYKNEDDKEAYDYYQIVPEDTPGYVADNYQSYSLSDNYLISNCRFNSKVISEILEELGQHIGNIRYMPASVDIKGMPWLEAGDVINILTKDDGIETIVLSRDLSGIHTLKDSLESK